MLIRKIWVGVITLPITLYKLVVSPLLGHNCRFYPSCSDYTKQAIIKHGAIKGVWLGIKRLSKCHPWGGSGEDEVK